MRFLVTLAVAVMLLSPRAHAGVMLQGFFWDAPSYYDNTWWDKLSSMSTEISKAGFTSVWIPPVLKGAAGGYSNGYDPFDDFDIGSKDQRGTIPTHWGTREQLLRSVAVMRANGLEVYVDNVLGQRNGDDGNSHFRYKNAFGEDNKGRFEKWPDFFTGTSSGFGRLPNFWQNGLRGGLFEAGDWMMNTLGVQGQRIDLASKVPTDFLLPYLNYGAMAGKFVVSEYWSENIGELSHFVHQMQGRTSVFDFPLWGILKDMQNANGLFDMRKLQAAGYVAKDPTHAVTFVDNHDTARGYPTYRNKHLGYAYILTSEGFPSVFWQDYFDWGFRKTIDTLIWVHENLADGRAEWRWADEDLLVYERMGKRGLLVALNDNTVSGRGEWVQTNFGGNVTLHDYTGNGGDITTAADGRVRVGVPPNSFVAYAPQGLGGAEFRPGSYEVTQQISGIRDLDVKPALPGDFAPAGRIWVEANTYVKADLYWRDGLLADGNIQVAFAPEGGAPEQVINQSGQNMSAHGQYRANRAGWYSVLTRVESKNKSQGEVSFWLNLKYQAPKR